MDIALNIVSPRRSDVADFDIFTLLNTILMVQWRIPTSLLYTVPFQHGYAYQNNSTIISTPYTHQVTFSGSSHPHSFTPQHIHTRPKPKPHPLTHIPHHPAHGLNVVQPSIQELSRLRKTLALVRRHEQLRRRVDPGKRASLGVPRCIDRDVAREVEDLVREEGELAHRERDIRWEGEER